MAVQSRDDILYEESETALLAVPGMFSEMLQENIAFLRRAGQRGPIRGRTPATAGAQEFLSACQAKLAIARQSARINVEKASLTRCAELALLTGQFEPSVGKIQGSPNAFAFELDLLASVCPSTRIFPRTTFRQVGRYRNALSALSAARLIGILQHYAAHTQSLLARAEEGDYQPDLSIEQIVSTNWQFLRGRSHVYPDAEFISALFREINDRDDRTPPIDSLGALRNKQISDMIDIIGRFNRVVPANSGRLWHVANVQKLLDTSKPLSIEECKTLDYFSRQLYLSGDNLAGAPSAVRGWLTLLSLHPDRCGRNKDLSANFVSPLIDSPILEVPGRGFLLATIHSLTTDLSFTLQRRLEEKYAREYFEARGRALESESVRHLRRAFATDAQFVQSARYSDGTPGEDIEVDAVFHWNDICVIVEAKSGHLLRSSHLGNRESLIQDLSKTVSDGYFQALRLMATLERLGVLDLRDSSGKNIRLQSRSLRRFYVLVPILEELGPSAIGISRLWNEQALPTGALPCIIALADLAVITDMLDNASDLVAYLEFREEILASINIVMADEMEILGAYICGRDPVARFEMQKHNYSAYREFQVGPRALREMVFVDPNLQEKHVNPWIGKATEARNRGQRPPEPPRRHPETVRLVLRRLDVSKGSLPGAVASAADREILERIPNLRAAGPKQRCRIASFPTRDVLVLIPPTVSLSQARKEAREARRDARRVIFFRVQKDESVALVHAERGDQNSLRSSDNSPILAARSRSGDFDEWYQKFAAHRKKRHGGLSESEQIAREELISSGLAPDLATGVVRQNLVQEVQQMCQLGVRANAAANFWLSLASDNSMRYQATRLAPTQCVKMLQLIQAGQVQPAEVPDIVQRLTAAGPDVLVENVVEAGPKAGGNSYPGQELERLVSTTLTRLRTSGPGSWSGEVSAKQAKKLQSLVMGELRGQLDAADLKAAAAETARQIQSQ